jgi:hypothetical protein
LVGRGLPFTEGFLAVIDLLLGERLVVLVGFQTPIEPVHKSRTVAGIGKLLDAPSELLA